MSIQDALTELGIRPRSDAPPPATLADTIEYLVFEQYPFICDWRLKPHPTVVTALVDLHADLSVLMLRIQHTLSQSGHAILTEVKPPKVDSSTTLNGTPIKETCQHKMVKVDESRAHLICSTCNTLVNPMWWLAKFTKELKRAEDARHALRKENDKLRAENELLKKERNTHRAAVRRKKAAGGKA